jgi:glucosamine 6-phosphate synthetase-like amidotransferase/phosphosugar isomerase protein
MSKILQILNLRHKWKCLDKKYKKALKQLDIIDVNIEITFEKLYNNSMLKNIYENELAVFEALKNIYQMKITNTRQKMKQIVDNINYLRHSNV